MMKRNVPRNLTTSSGADGVGRPPTELFGSGEFKTVSRRGISRNSSKESMPASKQPMWDPMMETREEMRSRIIRLVDSHKTVPCTVDVKCCPNHNQRRCIRFHNMQDCRPCIWYNWVEPSPKSCSNKTITSYHPSVIKSIPCHHGSKCPFMEVCGFLHEGEVKLDRKYGVYSRDQWIQWLDEKLDEHFGVETVFAPKLAGIALDIQRIASSVSPPPMESPHVVLPTRIKVDPDPPLPTLPVLPPLPPLPPTPTPTPTIIRGMNLPPYELNALRTYPQLVERVNRELSDPITCSIGKIAVGKDTIKDGLVLVGQAGEIHFHLGHSIIEHMLRDLGEEYEFNKTFRFNDERTRDNVAATLKAFGQEAFSGPDGNTSLRITEDGMAHLRILKGTTTYMKGVAEVVKSVLTCPGI
jgi:hypothetical protein